MGSSNSKGSSEAVYQPAADKCIQGFLTENIHSLAGKTVAVTGTTSGTGFYYALAAAQSGATVILLNRKSERSEKSLRSLKAECPEANFDAIECDLASFTSVRAAASLLNERYAADGIDVMCNNAGVMALPDTATEDGFDIQMQTNHLSHFLLCSLIYPLLETAQNKRGDARIVNHSSIARNGVTLQEKYFGQGASLGGNGASMFCGGARWQRYAQTKMANCVFTHALKTRLAAKGSSIKAVCAAPGLATTNLQATAHDAGGMSSGCFGNLWIMRMAQSAADGSMGILLASFGEHVTSGEFFEPSGMGGVPNSKAPAGKEASESQAELLWKCSEKAIGASWL